MTQNRRKSKEERMPNLMPMLIQVSLMLSLYRCPYQLDIPMLNGKQYRRIVMWHEAAWQQGKARQDSEVATQENIDSIVNDGGANSLITLATPGLSKISRRSTASTADKEVTKEMQG
jgi:hypothetical protein